MPESESLRQRFEDDLRIGLRRLTDVGIAIDCGGARHRMVVDGAVLRAADHDDEAEAVLGAVGGPAPACLEVVAAIAAAGPPQLWAALTSTGTGSQHRIPDGDLRVLLARSLRDEFGDASVVVRDSVARLGRSLLSADFRMTPAIAAKFQMTREFPRWDTGPVAWSDRDLVFLARSMRMSKGEARPHLAFLPADPFARRTVATYLIGLVDEHRLHSRDDLRRALSPTFHNVRAVIALLVSEHLLAESDGGYRVVASTSPARRMPISRRRARTRRG